MKIVLIHGQNHKGSSYTIGRRIADKINAEKEITEFFLPKDLNHFCIGCYNCIDDNNKCPFYIITINSSLLSNNFDFTIYQDNWVYAPNGGIRTGVVESFSKLKVI